ncbi:MAG TPA: 30S ribosomal protein S17e [Candidatus Nanoarchaeia archaeon]|nr:30S ribosomal protein S17e [Candidatus Nanoarchaeia archaeon]
MGRIKTTFIKRKTKELLNMHGSKFTSEFEQNKKVTAEYTKGGSKKLRNVIAGYLTRLKKQEE